MSKYEGNCFNAKKLKMTRLEDVVPDSPRFCIGQCKKRGYTQAGLKNGDECWCSNKQPSNNQKVHLRHCNKMCMSMTPESCGGTNHFTIFTTQCKCSYNRFIIKMANYLRKLSINYEVVKFMVKRVINVASFKIYLFNHLLS